MDPQVMLSPPKITGHFVIPLYKLRFSRGPTRHCPPRWFHICLLRICLPICIGILLGGNGRMKVVMHLGHGRKERKTTRPFCFVFFFEGEEYGRICVLFLLGGVGKNMQKYLISVFGRENEYLNLYPAVWAEMELLELDSFVYKKTD